MAAGRDNRWMGAASGARENAIIFRSFISIHLSDWEKTRRVCDNAI